MLHFLGYAGLIPFIFLPLISLVWPVMAPAQAMLLFQFYGCLILGFMAGVIWPVLYQANRPSARALAAVSFPVFAILGIALFPAYALLIVAALFFALRAYEYLAKINKHYSPAYQSLRNQLTAVVIACHIAFFIGFAYVA